jgi:type I restriction enzyme R subunit
MEQGPRIHRDNVPAARRLRKELTQSEAIVWEKLRDRRFYGLKFRRQHPVGAFVLDFFCQEMMFAIEVDSGIHRDPEVAARDRERETLLRKQHILFFRWAAEAVERDVDKLLLNLAIDLGIEPPRD